MLVRTVTLVTSPTACHGSSVGTRGHEHTRMVTLPFGQEHHTYDTMAEPQVVLLKVSGVMHHCVSPAHSDMPHPTLHHHPRHEVMLRES